MTRLFPLWLIAAVLLALGGAATAAPDAPARGPVTNADSAVRDMTRAAGRAKVDDVMIEYFDPEGWNLGGHLSISMRDPDHLGKRIIFNIANPKLKEKLGLKERFRLLTNRSARRQRTEARRGKMVNFETDIRDHLFGTQFPRGSQGGIYNRSILIVGIGEVSDDRLRSMIDKAKDIQKLDRDGKARFITLGSTVLNRLRIGKDGTVWGNCSTFADEVLRAGDIDVKSEFPKKSVVRTLELESRRSPDGIRVYHLQEDGKTSPRRGPVSLLDLPRTIRYWRHERMADVKVRVDRSSNRAVVNRAARVPSWRRRAESTANRRRAGNRSGKRAR